ncbi:MAG: gliding motility-associated C-terminal domain-containing protein, partial [Bacteroidia bacterium]|nr:gliding motility-associated C-terminal domain-containing protein [Bacteroidia bacterium]
EPGTYCVDSLETDVTIFQPPVAQFSWKQESCTPFVQFLNQSIGADRFFWDFGDGTSSQTANPIKTWSESDSFRVVLMVADSNDCRDTLIQMIDYDITGAGKIFIPNVFTPNGDGINDEFRILGTNADCMQLLEVFDRWGVKIFESRTYQVGWNGTYQGKHSPEGAYVYIISGPGYRRTGTVTLLR